MSNPWPPLPINRSLTSDGTSIEVLPGSNNVTVTIAPGEAICGDEFNPQVVSGTSSPVIDNGVDDTIQLEGLGYIETDNEPIEVRNWWRPRYGDVVAEGTAPVTYDPGYWFVIEDVSEAVTSNDTDPIQSYIDPIALAIREQITLSGIASAIGYPATPIFSYTTSGDGHAEFAHRVGSALPFSRAEGFGDTLTGELPNVAILLEPGLVLGIGWNRNYLDYKTIFMEVDMTCEGTTWSINHPNHLDLEDAEAIGVGGDAETILSVGKVLRGVAKSSARLPILANNEPITVDTFWIIYTGRGGQPVADMRVADAAYVESHIPEGFGDEDTTLSDNVLEVSLGGFGLVGATTIFPVQPLFVDITGSGRTFGNFGRMEYFDSAPLGVGSIKGNFPQFLSSEPTGYGDVDIVLDSNRDEIEAIASGTGATVVVLTYNKEHLTSVAQGSAQVVSEVTYNKEELEVEPAGLADSEVTKIELESRFFSSASGVGRAVGGFEKSAYNYGTILGWGGARGGLESKAYCDSDPAGFGGGGAVLTHIVHIIDLNAEGIGSFESEAGQPYDAFDTSTITGDGSAAADGMESAELISVEPMEGWGGANASTIWVHKWLASDPDNSGVGSVEPTAWMAENLEVDGDVGGFGDQKSDLLVGEEIGQGEAPGLGDCAGGIQEYHHLLHGEVTGRGKAVGNIRDSSLGIVDNPKVVKYNEIY